MASAGAKDCNKPTMEDVKKLNINPTINTALTSKHFLATARMASKTANAPITAAIGIWYLPPTDADTPSVTTARASDAREVTPRTERPASGLRKRVCINKPARASAEPPTSATIALGNRDSYKI